MKGNRMFDGETGAAAQPGRRVAALSVVVLTALSCMLLASLSAEARRPVQSVAWVFGPAPAISGPGQ
jgi:hypothetical protein